MASGKDSYEVKRGKESPIRKRGRAKNKYAEYIQIRVAKSDRKRISERAEAGLEELEQMFTEVERQELNVTFGFKASVDCYEAAIYDGRSDYVDRVYLTAKHASMYKCLHILAFGFEERGFALPESGNLYQEETSW